MPLSEEELRLLEQMERALAEEDPKFVSTIKGTTIERAAKVRALAAGAVFLVGVAALLGGAVAQQIWLGVLGFIVMLTAAVVGLTAWRGRSPEHSHASGPLDPFERGFDGEHDSDGFHLIQGGRREKRRAKTPRKQGSFMQRMEQRWQRRQRGGY